MERTKKVLTLGFSTLLALSLLATPASAGDDNTTGEVSFSVVGFVERDPNDSAKFEEYREVPSGLVLDHVLFDWWGDNGGFVTLDVHDAVQDDQRFSFEAGRFDLFQATIDWTEVPHRWSDDVYQMHGYSGLSDGIAYFSLPDSLQDEYQFGGGNRGELMEDFILNGSQAAPAWKHRETGSADFRFTPSRNAIIGFAVSRDRRDGFKWSVNPTYFSDPGSEVSAPIDFVTDSLRVYAEINKRHWRLGGRLDWSEFDTGVDALVWDQQAFGTEDAPGHSPLMMTSGEVDHESFKWTLDGGFRLAGNTNINWVISQGQTETDDHLLPKTLGTMLGEAPSPIDRFYGEYDSNLYSLRISSHPIDWFGINAWWRKYEYENDSRFTVFDDYVVADHALGDARGTLQQGYEKTQYGLGLTFTPANWVDILLNYENVDMDREDAAVHSTDEDIFTVGLDFDVSEHVFIRAKYRWMERDTHEYDYHYLEHAGAFPDGEAPGAFNYGARRFYWTDRDREEWSLVGEFNINPQFAIFAEATWAQSDYMDPNTGQDVGTEYAYLEDRDGDTVAEMYDLLLAGRIEDEDQSYTLGFSASSPNHRVNFAIDHTWETWEWSMASRYRAPTGGVWGGANGDNPLNNWYTKVDDTYRTLHMTFDAELDDGGLWQLLADLTWSKGKGETDTFWVDGGSSRGDADDPQFPDVENELTVFQLSLKRKLSDAWDVGIQYWYEKWEESDWQSDLLEPWIGDAARDTGSATTQYLGRDYLDYENHVISLMATYKF